MTAALFLAFVFVIALGIVWWLDNNTDKRETLDPAYRKFVKGMEVMRKAQAAARKEEVEV